MSKIETRYLDGLDKDIEDIPQIEAADLKIGQTSSPAFQPDSITPEASGLVFDVRAARSNFSSANRCIGTVFIDPGARLT